FIVGWAGEPVPVGVQKLFFGVRLGLFKSRQIQRVREVRLRAIPYGITTLHALLGIKGDRTVA
ncbi:hypothetical protein, partial [Microcoleus sp. B13-B4]